MWSFEIYVIEGERDINTYMYLKEYVSTSEPHIIDSLHIQTIGEGDRITGNNEGDRIGQLNDTTELIQLEYQFESSIRGGAAWVRSVTVFVAVSPHKIQLVGELEYYSVECLAREMMRYFVLKKSFPVQLAIEKPTGFMKLT